MTGRARPAVTAVTAVLNHHRHRHRRTGPVTSRTYRKHRKQGMS